MGEEEKEKEEEEKEGGEAEGGEQNIGFIPWWSHLYISQKLSLDIHNAISSLFFISLGDFVYIWVFKPPQCNLRNLKIPLFNHWLETGNFSFVNASE